MTGQPVEIPKHVKQQLADESQLPAEIVLGGRRYTPQHVAGTGFKSVVWQVHDEHGRPRALKLATYEDYLDKSWTGELALAAPLEKHSVFARIIDAGRTSLPLADGSCFQAVYFVEDWVDGTSLRDFLRTRSGDVDAAFLLDYANHMTRALEALEFNDLAHDDLHTGNVMLADPIPGDDGHMQVRIIDMGSLKQRDRVEKDKYDLDHFADHLIEIYNVIVESRHGSRADQRFLAELKEVPLRRMVDPDRTIALRDPKLIRDAFVDADNRARYVGETPADRPMTSPFEFISSEHMSDDRTFIKLFAETPWLSKVASRDPTLVTGPRGCGKSTLFRWLSLRTQLNRDEPELDQFPIAGFYLSCSTELEGRFADLEGFESVHAWKPELLHFFNLLLARELLETLLLMAGSASHSERWHIGGNEENQILTFLQTQLGTTQIGIYGASRLRQALALVENERFHCDLSLRRSEHRDSVTSEVFIGDFCELLVDLIPFFADRRITFLIDDFTKRRVDTHVQRALNTIIWTRSQNHIFKVSSEKYGADLNDMSGKPIDAARELVPVDIGMEYLSLSEGDELNRARQFARELLDARLKAARYEGTAESLLGHSNWGSHGTLARSLRDAPKKKSHYHGLECIADLCSGDVATLLLVFRRIFEHGKVGRETNSAISAAVQHRAIVQASGEQVELLRDHFPCGVKMHTLVLEFGTFVADVLRKGRLVKKGDTQVPPTQPRIEVDGSNEASEQLSEVGKDLYEELLRRAVFIEMDPSRSRHGHVQTLRWQMRRIYLPNFGAALSKNVALKLGPAQFKFLLEDPTAARKVLWQRERKMPEHDKYSELTLEEGIE
jgi:serine/threonine protein kinase